MPAETFDVQFSGATTRYMFGDSIRFIEEITHGKRLIFITDENVASVHSAFWNGKNKIVIPAGEGSKNFTLVQSVFEQLIALETDRKTVLLGVGGGVVTDFTGFVASTYMRGVAFGFIPTSLLAMVDASIGGKNGVNVGLHKNMMGNIRQPSFLAFDTKWLSTLPREEWSNGFAEIIKYGCIFSAPLFDQLSARDLNYYLENEAELASIVRQCVLFKNHTVIRDEFETNERKLLNFGHTLAHPIESVYGLAHGKAVAIGMVFACRLSEMVNGLDTSVAKILENTLVKYELPHSFDYDVSRIVEILKMDKKKSGSAIEYILLNQLGEGVISKLERTYIENALYSCKH